MTIASSVSSSGPSDPPANACTELMIPVRDIKVPNRQRENVATIRMMFHTLSTPRLS